MGTRVKALVTGGTGFIGRHVTDCLLDDGHRVRVFSRRAAVPDHWAKRGVEVFRGDLEDSGSVINAMDGADVFFHIGEIRNTGKASSQENTRLIDLIVTNLRKKGIKRFVFISSITVSGIPSEMPASEETTPKIILNDHYTASKRRCEEIIAERSWGCEHVIVRPAPVYGPGSRYMGNLIEALGKLGPFGFPFIGNARNNAPLIYVKDLAQAICLSGLKENLSGRKFILTDGFRHSWFDFFKEITDLLDRKLRILPVPPLLLKISAVPFDLLSGMFGVELDPVSYVDYFSRDIYFDNSRAKDLLDWQPAYSLSEGVREMVRIYGK